MQAKTFTENARRAQIVRAAIETIGELGYAKASFGQIAKRAGLSSTGMISYHFDGKADLIAEVVRDVLATSLAYMRERIDAVRGPAAELRAYIESNLAFIAEHPVEITALLESLRHGGGVAAGNDDWYHGAVDILESCLREGQRSGDFGRFDPRVMAITVRQAIDGIHTELIRRPGTDADAYAAELVAIVERATAPG
ncbi:MULTISPECIES: TetR/AcrR family transcriptional regulator [unclassified Amycolatopsis]|uniref:TetR/AcrR family transcriptional regulator n=1 Tax=unclassified Amycolatopsis TaxID=2618356 RepID=UPI002876C125|nr:MULTISPECIES: TetR/AcrR family transcriptional regulator [unclassified Amycolatopsis]MDS0136250.1 TetR family transcriptional regulator [Amycolatopsis sp. 505]MDS0145765.1 TetR family transcriptional regulator [Amycolatopsis sp. CM201R]